MANKLYVSTDGATFSDVVLKELNPRFVENYDYAFSPQFISVITADITQGQGTWALHVDTSEPYNCVLWNDTNTVNDNFSVPFKIAEAGTYTIRFNASRSTNRGIIKVSIDDVDIETGIDLYKAAPADTINIKEITGVALTVGAHTIKFTVTDKNASSTGWYFVNGALCFIRTGA